ncbi:MAG: response regulator [Gemmatimonadales bacterium]
MLVVENEPAVRTITTRALREAGFVVLEADDGRDALAVLSQSFASVDLVLADVLMPRLGGLKLADELEESRPGLPIVLMSGYPAGDADLTSRAGTRRRWIGKPFSPDQLLRIVRSLLPGGGG